MHVRCFYLLTPLVNTRLQHGDYILDTYTKQPKHPGLRIQTLFFDANYTRDQICLQTGHTYDQVCYAIRHRLTPQKQKTGRRVVLNTPQRKKLIQWATASRENRETPWVEIPRILGLDCGEWLYVQPLKRRAIHVGFLEGSAPFLRRIERRDLNGQRSMLIRQTSNGMRFSRVMKHGHNLEDTHAYGLHAKLAKRKGITRIVYNTVTKGRSDGCFGG